LTLGLLISAIIDGLAYAMVIYLIAAGLVIIFGLMDILNFAHASFFMLSLYITITLMSLLNYNFILTVIIVTAMGFLIGALTELVLMRPLYGKPTAQMLVTMGLMLIIVQIVVVLWPMGLTFPATTGIFRETIKVLGYRIYIYRLIVFMVGIVVFIALEAFLNKTKFGAQIRAGTENRTLAEIYGIDVKKIFTIAFGLGTALAFFGGSIVSPWFNASVEAGTSFTLLAFAVIVIGGMKSHKGAFIASLLIGLVHQLTAYFVTELSFVIDIILMIVVLLVKPEGLFGGEAE